MKNIITCMGVLCFIFCLNDAKADTGCKSFTPVSTYPIYSTYIGSYNAKPLYDFEGVRYLLKDFNCLRDTGRGCYIRITQESQCTDGCVRVRDANGFYYKPGTEYEFDASNPDKMCDLEDSFLLISGAIIGVYLIRKQPQGKTNDLNLYTQ